MKGKLVKLTEKDKIERIEAIQRLIEFDGKDSNARLKKHDDIVDSLSASANHLKEQKEEGDDADG